MTTDWKALCQELLIDYEQHLYRSVLADRARAALAEPVADGPAVQSREPASVATQPSDEELLELSQFHCVSYTLSNGSVVSPFVEGTDMRSEVLSFARAVLARWGHQPAPPAAGEQRHPTPVPVNEHPWKRDRWCDDEDRCWCFNQWDLQWELENYTSGAHWCEWMLPATALPLPQEEVQL